MRTKLVIRRLPPTLPEDVFWAATATWVNEETCSYKRYVAGRPEADPPVHSRAYVVLEPERIQAFHSAFDGHVFKPKTGPPYAAVVEFAPLQKTVKQKTKVDSRQGTIDTDEDYLSFIRSLQEPTPMEHPTVAPPPTSTPLLDHLRAKKPDTRTAALNAVNAAAARRAPKGAGGDVVMVAGKGREVHLGPSSSIASSGSNDDNSRSRRKQRREATAPSSSGEVKQGQQPKGQKQPQPPRPPRQQQQQQPQQSLATQVEGHLAQAGAAPGAAAGGGRGKSKGRGRGRGGRGGGAGGRGGAAGGTSSGAVSGRIDD